MLCAHRPTPCSVLGTTVPLGYRTGSVVAWRRLKDDPFELGERIAAETKGGLEALESEFAGVERPPEFVECRSLVVEHLLARSVQQNQVSRAPQAMREAHIAFALFRIKTLERQNDALARLQPLENGAGEEFAGTLVDLAIRNPAGQQFSDPSRRERRPPLLDDSLGESCGLGGLGTDDHEKAPGGVTKTMGRSQDAAPDRHVDGARRGATCAWALR